jgi:nitrite reductase (NADH) large subunit
VVVVGCGVAGFTAATTIRQNDPKVVVSVYTDEKSLFYPRPELYRALSGEVPPSDIIAFSEQWYEKRGIRVYLEKKVSKIDTAKKELLLEDGSRVSYDKLLLANGALPFVPPIDGVGKTGVFSLRSLEDAITIRNYAKKMVKAIVIGGGLLGLELASSLRKLGLQVEVVEIFPKLLPKQLDADGAIILKDRIATLGIDFELGAKTVEILGRESVSGVALDNGKQLPGDFVLFSAGISSNTELAAEAGIKVNRGVIIDQYLRTSAYDVYAAGDVAEFKGRVYGIIPAATEQGRIAAMNIASDETRVYEGTIPSNTLKIVGIDLTSMGLVAPEEPGYEEIKKVNRENGVYKKIVLKQGKIVGAIILGDTRNVASIKRLMDQGIEVTKWKDAMLEDNFDYRKIPS